MGETQLQFLKIWFNLTRVVQGKNTLHDLDSLVTLNLVMLTSLDINVIMFCTTTIKTNHYETVTGFTLFTN